MDSNSENNNIVVERTLVSINKTLTATQWKLLLITGNYRQISTNPGSKTNLKWKFPALSGIFES